ncbi:prenyltransferase, partial [Rhizobiaceae sp. 2RAB30]
MDVRSDGNTVPLAVDLDGTLIATDLLWEGLFLLVRKNPFFLFMVPVWIVTGGPARLKLEIAARVDIDATVLPYRPVLLDRLRKEREAGRKIILA